LSQISENLAVKQLTTLTAPPIQLVDSNFLFDCRLEIVLMIFFGNLCPSLVSTVRKCNIETCLHEHSPPSAEHLELQLLRNSKSDAEEVYTLVNQFPENLRTRFLPVFLKVFVQRQQFKALKDLVKDCQDRKINIRFIVVELERQGWGILDALKLIHEALN
jgi:hypothetical protein